MALKVRGGSAVSGVEGQPEADDPLDPEPGLGGILSVGLLREKASLF
jgi:hypothetical protein